MARTFVARYSGMRPPKNPRLVLVGSPTWARAHHRHLLRHESAQLVDPGPGLLLCAIGQRARTASIWLGDLNRDLRQPTQRQSAATSPEQEFIGAVETRFDLLQASMSSWASAGRRAGGSGVVAVAAQDVLPPQRAFLLGFRAAGGRIITLEHGLSGGYSEQVSSAADVLAAWGEPQAAYHRTAGPAGLRVVAVGWPRLESAVALAPPAADDSWDLLHFSQPSEDLSAGNWPEANLHALQLVEDYARQHADRKVAIKLHPASQGCGLVPPPIQHARMVTGESLQLIGSARVVVVVSSTTGIEAMSLGRPVLQVPPRGYVGPTEFIGDSGAAPRVDSVEQLAAAMEHLLSDRSAYGDAVERGRAFARAFIHGFGQPGMAVRQLADLVAELQGS